MKKKKPKWNAKRPPCMDNSILNFHFVFFQMSSLIGTHLIGNYIFFNQGIILKHSNIHSQSSAQNMSKALTPEVLDVNEPFRLSLRND